ncbi:MAG: hypothetical protein A2428_14365 [Bdellovibrionales bacterium RIFOXYC1_FULL_54_43]|nr:MAG: hypothetical protein A2428_14365 [Bdellovibrionales bacterium RIFOXYC1_FULL_54_43]OFZ85018.1 MAG: hypothetical protein A2603_04070 [Bdellovibrionales bacterium RIFOXYD1_FULL_55_31]
MRMLLRTEFPNGPFGDPSLYIWQIDAPRALLFDAGDLSRFTTRQLLKVDHLFISHCHIDHFFGFDLFLRLHIGSEKNITVFGPPSTSEHVAGKLRGYTWNLIHDQNLSFDVIDLDHLNQSRLTTRFHAKAGFEATDSRQESWNPSDPIFDNGLYRIRSALLDHRTPCLAYSIEERPSVRVLKSVIDDLGLQAGPWLEVLKTAYLSGMAEETVLQIPRRNGETWVIEANQLATQVLEPRQRHKLAYATDGAASRPNRESLLQLVESADLFFCETCFLNDDSDLARRTQHFTATFVAELARDARVKRLAPFHFSKRYLKRPEVILKELSTRFPGEILPLVQEPRQLRL